MKLNPISEMTAACRALLIAAFVLMSGGALKAQNFFDNAITVGASTIDLGNASGGASNVVSSHKNWAIFALSGGVTITDPSSQILADVVGNIGMGGSGYLNMSVAWVSGSVYNSAGSNYGAAVVSGGSTISGTGGAGPSVTPLYLSNAVASAQSASLTAGSLGNSTGTGLNALTYTGALSPTPGIIALSGPAANSTITGTANQTYVMNLTNLVLANSVLTLVGTPTTNFVFNIAQYMVLSNNAQIQLSGGLTSKNVLFNVQSNTPQYDVTLSGGSSVSGIILAPTRNVKLTGASVVTGEVIANAVSLAGASRVVNPFVSP